MQYHAQNVTNHVSDAPKLSHYGCAFVIREFLTLDRLEGGYTRFPDEFLAQIAFTLVLVVKSHSCSKCNSLSKAGVP